MTEICLTEKTILGKTKNVQRPRVSSFYFSVQYFSVRHLIVVLSCDSCISWLTRRAFLPRGYSQATTTGVPIETPSRAAALSPVAVDVAPQAARGVEIAAAVDIEDVAAFAALQNERIVFGHLREGVPDQRAVPAAEVVGGRIHGSSLVTAMPTIRAVCRCPEGSIRADLPAARGAESIAAEETAFPANRAASCRGKSIAIWERVSTGSSGT